MWETKLGYLIQRSLAGKEKGKRANKEERDVCGCVAVFL